MYIEVNNCETLRGGVVSTFSYELQTTLKVSHNFFAKIWVILKFSIIICTTVDSFSGPHLPKLVMKPFPGAHCWKPDQAEEDKLIF